MRGLVASIICSRRACSEELSVSLAVETWCCASTARQALPSTGLALNDSSSGVQIVDDIHKPRHRLDQLNRSAVERCVRIGQPFCRNLVVSSGQSVQRAVEANEEHRQLEGLLAGLQGVFTLFHSRNCRIGDANDAGENPVAEVKLFGGAHSRFSDQPRVRMRRMFLGNGHRLHVPSNSYPRAHYLKLYVFFLPIESNTFSPEIKFINIFSSCVSVLDPP